MKINCCPSCLKTGYETFCNPCQKKLFNGKKVSHILTFSKPFYEQTVIEKGGKISISGVQPKHSLRLNGNILELTEEGGEYILKPCPTAIMENVEQLPANEHLTMQIASQLFKMSVAKNALLFFKDSYEPCYLTKRFDRKSDGTKLNVEDFTQIAGKTEENDGIEYKYKLSYEEIAEILKDNCSAYPIEVEKFFKAIIFNYLINNGDAHMKNFSMLRNDSYKDYLLSPQYDLLNTRIHFPKDTEIALDLFKKGYATDSFKTNAHFLYQDFFEFGIKIGVKENRVKKFLSAIISKYNEIEDLTQRSFLNEDTKKLYLEYVRLSIKKLSPI
ncbi:MAG TPA: HipA domain-containing protein [Ignavibacteria bacterium]